MILSKYWYILADDPYLKNDISEKPVTTFRRAGTLKNSLAPSNFNKTNHRISVVNTRGGVYKACTDTGYPWSHP